MTSTQFKRLRKLLKFTQAKMAEEMGYSSLMVISNKERGRRGITKYDLLQIQTKWKLYYNLVIKAK